MEADSKNPYQSPDITPAISSDGLLRESKIRFSFRAALFVLLCGIVGCGVGGTLGFVIAGLIPDYYRSVASYGNRPGFDPVAFGVGQGLTQGLAGGICVGLVLVALSWLFKYRLQRNKPG